MIFLLHSRTTGLGTFLVVSVGKIPAPDAGGPGFNPWSGN